MRLILWSRRVVAPIAGIWDLVAAAAMFAIMVIVTTDVAARYLFNSPIPWAYDLVTWYLMPAVFFFALGSTLRHRQHINIDLVFRMAGPSLQRLLRVIGALLSTAVFTLIVRLGTERAYSAALSGEIMNGELPWPTSIYHSFIPLGLGLLIVGLLIEVGEAALDMSPSKDPSEDGKREPGPSGW